MRGAHQAFFLMTTRRRGRLTCCAGIVKRPENYEWCSFAAAVAERILELLAGGPMRPSALRKAVGICSSIHFNRYYLPPLLEKGVIAQTDPDHPQSPQQRYYLT